MKMAQSSGDGTWADTVAVIGLGYAGLPLALAFAEAGVRTIGYDVDAERVSQLQRRCSYIPDVSPIRLAAVSELLTVSADTDVLAQAKAFIVCVQTPVAKNGEADLTYVNAALGTIGRYIREGTLVVLQSTVPPGTTAAAADRLSRQTGLAAGEQFHVAIAPERIDPASRGGWTVASTPKLVAGLTPECSRRAQSLFAQAVGTVLAVANPEIAEIAKIFENTFRLVNIALTYELADVCKRRRVPVRSVIEAAATKPYGFMAHWPGPGVGGECIPVDPLFLSAYAARADVAMPLVEGAIQHIRGRPIRVVDRLAELIRAEGGDLSGSRVLVVGAAYKPGVADTRNSPALDIIRELRRRDSKPQYTDPLVERLTVDGEMVESVAWDRPAVANHDCLVLVTPHEQIMRKPLWDAVPLVLDTWHLLPTGNGVHYP